MKASFERSLPGVEAWRKCTLEACRRTTYVEVCSWRWRFVRVECMSVRVADWERNVCVWWWWCEWVGGGRG